MERERQVLQILADGAFHSGEALAAQLGGLSRAAIWKVMRTLEERGIIIYAVRGRGYRLAEPIEFLDSVHIEAELDDDARDRLHLLEVHQDIDSTNTYLMKRAADGLASGTVCIAEAQSGGRGRRGRAWVSPYAANLYLSLLWRFTSGPALLSGLSLAIGVAVARALHTLGITEVGLKWPNDLLWDWRKLGGILLEFGGESSGPCHVVAGVGVNVAMPECARKSIDQPWTDLRSILGPNGISRNRLAARVVSEMLKACARFEQQGFAPPPEWQQLDVTLGQRITLQLPNNTCIDGISRGIDNSGALLLETATGIQRFLGGEISLRRTE